jgi:hypothetical protein
MLRKSLFRVPGLGIAFAFLLTVAAARFISLIAPGFHSTVEGVHVHHYVYGIFILTAAGYLALTFKGARATFWIALLYGLGVGLTFDEFGFWINPVFQRGVRWNSNGITAIVLGLLLVALIPVLSRRITGESSATIPVPVISEVVVSENPD